jgi:MGT family glycosyltransferase
MSYNFLLVSWGTSGNLNPLLTAGRQLRRRGHHIRLMADPAMRDEVVAAGFDFATWRRAPVGRAADPDDFTDMADWIRRAVFDPAAAYAADVRDEVARHGTDAVLSIDILYGAVLGAEAAGVPAAMLSPHVSIRPLPGVPVATTGLAAPKTLQQRAEVDAANERFATFMNGFRSHLNGSCAQLGVAAFDHVMDIYDRPRRLLLAMSQAFDFQADWLPANVRYIGPLLDQPSWSEPWRAPWQSQTDHPRALIACSTGAQGQGELVQRIINAMGQTEIHCVTTAGPNLDVGSLTAPPNVHLVRSAPHNTVMSEVSLVITQGGHGTVNRALINGLPLLVLPMGRDQFDNAARVEAKGAGLHLPATASEAEIAAAATRLVSEPHFRLAARGLGAAIKADLDSDGLAREMEDVAAMPLHGRIQPVPAATARMRGKGQRATM